MTTRRADARRECQASAARLSVRRGSADTRSLLVPLAISVASAFVRDQDLHDYQVLRVISEQRTASVAVMNAAGHPTFARRTAQRRTSPIRNEHERPLRGSHPAAAIYREATPPGCHLMSGRPPKPPAGTSIIDRAGRTLKRGRDKIA
jgi:hypothetical protein